jgi:putative membrane protein
MLKFVSKTILTSVAILVAAYILKGVEVDNTITAVLVAAALGFLNSFVRPILIVLTIPITMVTLGLFLIIINVLIVYWVTKLVPGFKVESFSCAFLFSFIVSIISSVLERFINKFDASKSEEE